MKHKRKKKDKLIPNNPHDGFFKVSFSRKDVAQEYLEKYLPAGLKIIENSPSPLKSYGMSTYDMLIEKGSKEQKIETIRKGLKNNLPLNILCDLTDMSEQMVLEIIEQLEKKGKA